MKKYGVFDILGPVMIGPSSSHTAGAARLGNIAQIIVGEPFKEVTFYLHGSFAQTAKGHGTDRALLAGVLGMDPSDDRLAQSFDIAAEKNLKYSFVEKDLGYQHPNTVKIEFVLETGETSYVMGSSIGGGNIIVTDMDGTEVQFAGNTPTIIVRNKDTKGVIAHISTVLADNGINVANMSVVRKDDIATMVIEVDSKIEDELIEEMASLKDILVIKGINPIKEWLNVY